MARETEPDKAALLAESAAARARLAETGESLRVALDEVRQKLDVPARAKESFQEHKAAWLGSAGILGLLLSKIPARQKTVIVGGTSALASASKLSMLWGAAKLVGSIAKPFIGEITGERLAELARRYSKKAKPPVEPDHQPPR